MKKEEMLSYALKFQENEITEYHIYSKLAEKSTRENKKVLLRIAKDELRHYNEWKKFTKREVKPLKKKIFKYLLIAKIFGITFAIKMLEGDESNAQHIYFEISKVFPVAKKILKDEVTHEKLLINMINEEKIKYIGSMVLGLNDALVELTGALAGLTFALLNTRLVGVAGLITGISASFSMAASEYLSQKSEKNENPFKASIYTGIAYIGTVLLLVFPYFLFKSYYFALGLTIFNGIVVVLIFTFFVSVVKSTKFGKLFFEMLFISLGVAIFSFLVGSLTRKIIPMDM